MARADLGGVLTRATTSLLLLALAWGRAEAQQLAMTRVRADSVAVIQQLGAAGFEVAGVIREAGTPYALIVTTPEERDRLGIRGYVVGLVPPRVREPPQHYRDFTATHTWLADLAARHPRVWMDTLGTSVEGRPVLAIKLGEQDDLPDRPNVLFVGTHHAREWIAAEFTRQLIAHLADTLAATSERAALVGSRDVWVVPILNPDGYQHTFDAQRLWRKNRRLNGDGSFGVDLNRNYPTFWGLDDVGSSGRPSAETYRGPAAASEPEVTALMAFHQQHPPVVAVSYHSFTDVVLYPYGHADGRLAPDRSVFEALAGTPLVPAIMDRLAGTTRRHYYPGPGWQLYPTNGEYTEWAYRAHGTLPFTIELTSGCCVDGVWYGFEFPDDSVAIAQVVRDNLPFALRVLDAAADPGRLQAISGEFAGRPAVETAWPEIRVTGPAGSPSLPIVVRRGGTELVIALRADSLDRGVLHWRWSGSAAVGHDTEIEVPGLGLRTRVLAMAGADTGDGWRGWSRDTTRAVEGASSWRSAGDTLVSPALNLEGVAEPHLVFWTRHTGSLFDPDRHGRVEVSADGGVSWQRVATVAGLGGEWYPVRVLVTGGSDHTRFRFIADGLPWWVDAVQVLGTPPPALMAARQGRLGVSENPVRSDRVFFTWTPAAGDATLHVFTFAGDLVYRETLPAQTGRLAWDLTNVRGEGVHNGAYVAVLRLDDETLRQRVLVARSQ